MLSIFEKASEHFKRELPFVIYSKPNSAELNGFFQKNNRLYQITDFAEKGFVFADFKNTQSILFPENESEVLHEIHNYYEVSDEIRAVNVPTDGKEAFENLVQKGIKAIENGAFKKVVLSRKEILRTTDFDFIKVFQKIGYSYPTAFRYCWFHPEIGMWLGASPEQLLKLDDYKFKTVALAGTQKWNPSTEAIWGEKELQEQQFVTDFIVSNFESEVEKLTQTNPYTYQAGNLVHLKTDIEGVLKKDFNLKKVLQFLHPTPAVCGLPREPVKQFILANEGYDRKFYAGFLGELNMVIETDLFVNLRCMEIQQNEVHLYIGCGITKDSDPKKEYFETAIKAMTMKQILN
jgi:isochorismate synthase